jgi:hypothetical protein
MMPSRRIVSAALALVLGACATIPSGPGVMVMPGSRKNFDQFRADDYACRDYAHQYVGGKTNEQVAAQSGVASAAVGTAIGAAAGAAIGGSQGAAVGAGTGLVFGSAVGASSGYASSYELQARYDSAYTQCMYAKGNRVPVAGGMAAYDRAPPQAQPRGAPPPPAGLPPAPPPPAGLPPAPPPR